MEELKEIQIGSAKNSMWIFASKYYLYVMAPCALGILLIAFIGEAGAWSIKMSPELLLDIIVTVLVGVIISSIIGYIYGYNNRRVVKKIHRKYYG